MKEFRDLKLWTVSGSIDSIGDRTYQLTVHCDRFSSHNFNFLRFKLKSLELTKESAGLIFNPVF
jgi:hypothetical protein